MRVDDLRSLSLFDGLTDDQLAELIDGGTEVRSSPASTCSARASTPTSGGCSSTVRSTSSATSAARTPWSRRMDVPGRWAGGFRAWDEHGVYLATGRGVTAGRVLRVPADVLRELSNCAGSRSADTSSRGCTAPRAPSSRPRGSANPWSPSARWPPASRTRSTIRPRPRPGRSTPSRPRARRCSRRSAGSPTTRSRPTQFAALDALRREIEPTPADAGSAGPRRPRAGPLGLARPATASSATGPSPRRSPPPESISPGASGPRPCCEGPALRAGPGVGGEHVLGRHAAVGGEGVDAAHLRARRRRPVVLADGPRVDAAAST